MDFMEYIAGQAKIIDVSFLLDPPAGKHGFLKVGGDGHFYFEDGTRARFWGYNVCSAAAMPTHQYARAIARHLANFGCNVVRIHAIDGTWQGKEYSIIDYINYNDSQHLNLAMLDRLDYFIAELKKNGIYIYMDLLDYRVWRDGDGLRNADMLPPTGRPITIWNERMIELQKKYAHDLLTHINPYTGLSYVDDPAIAIVELSNEISLFWQSWTQVPEPYLTEIRNKWNKWLLKKYGSREKLDEAWTDAEGRHALRSEEDPQKNNVALPNIVKAWQMDWHRDYTDPETSPARCNDGNLFAYEIEREFYREMRNYLREIGVKVPITANVTTNVPPDLKAVADELDFTAGCHYFAPLAGWSIHPPPMFRRYFESELRSATINNVIPFLAQGKVAGKPYVIREWNFFPHHPYRSEALIQVAAYAVLNDWDGVILYDYLDKRPETIDCSIQGWDAATDPSLWAQAPIAAIIYLRGDVSVARHVLEVGCSYVDTFYAWASHINYPSSIASYICRVQRRFFDYEYTGEADIIFSSGASSYGSYSKAKHAVLFSENPWCDLYNKALMPENLALKVYPELSFVPLSPKDLVWDRRGPWITFKDFIFDEFSAFLGLTKAIRAPTWGKAFGILSAIYPERMGPEFLREKLCIGFIDDQFLVMLNPLAIYGDYYNMLARIFLDASKYWGIMNTSHMQVDRQCLLSETEEISRDYGKGILTVNTPRTQAALGFIGGEKISLNNIEIEATTKHCAIAISSLDNKPISESRTLLLIAVNNAVNHNAEIVSISGIKHMRKSGTFPITIEPVKAKITLKIPASPRNVRIEAYDFYGKERASIETKGETGAITFETETNLPAIFYIIRVER